MEEKCGWCVWHNADSYCTVAKLYYGENREMIQTDYERNCCELFVQSVYEGIRNIAITPGYHIAELMEDRHMTANDLDDDVSGVLFGKEINEATAQKLAETFGPSKGFWMNLQASFKKKYTIVQRENEQS